ncbi:MAG: TrkA family potassium uptake protein [Dehalococcoidia bacterium]|nr:TrkA family potassium uptake protein [Dehalococcoidia bacterium]
MYIIVVGCGNIGFHLAKALVAIGHEVLVIDKDQHRCETLRDELESIDVAMHGDGTQIDVLKSAGAVRADVLIAVAATDHDNLAACQVAKHSFATPRTMALVRDPQNEALFKTSGVDVTIGNTHPIVSTIEEGIPGHALVHLMNLKPRHMEMVSITIPPDAAVAGSALESIELPPNSFITLIVKDDNALLPWADVVVDAGDDVVVVTSIEEEHLLYEILVGAG